MPDTPQRSQRLPESPEGRFVLRIEPPPDDEPELGEYDYVISDLKRVAAVAATVFALLIGLSFLFR